MFEMLKRKSRFGLATLCIASGQGSAVILENMQI
jgi:acetyl-CoA acetyltransferase